jgi:antitoxin component YwqK of YwqJK toxin-antitoxin module
MNNNNKMESDLKQITTYYKKLKSDKKYSRTIKEVYFINRNQKKDGQYIKYHRNQKKQSEYTYIDGVKNGEFFTYYYSGWLQKKGNMKHNNLDGEIIDYYESGKQGSQYMYKNNKINGICYLWYENGKQKTICSYKNNFDDGEYKDWRENGTLKLWHYYIWNDHYKIKYIKFMVHAWYLLTKFINLKKERRMIKKLLENRNQITSLEPIIYITITNYLNWDERRKLIK